jgi:hydrogenase maturation protein HypF
MHQLNVPIVATSGNISDEPICTDEIEALDRLRGIADMFLVHNRPIVRHVDDSVARVVMGRELILRRARGYAPMPVPVKSDRSLSVLAVGAHLKNTVAISRGDNVFLSQHIGDLETEEAFNAFKKVIRDFQSIYELTPDIVACDLHPEYLSTKYAMEMYANVERVQHHYAHVASCMAENELDGRVLGVSWDGTGYGLDGTVWGGEFLLTDDRSFTRIAALRRFRLPGSEQAIKEPRRSAIGLLYEIFGEALLERTDLIPLQSFSAPELRTLLKMLKNGLNSPLTSSVGRLFDALASIVGLRQVVAFEGQAAMEIEYAAKGLATSSYPFELHPSAECQSKLASDLPMSEIMIDWAPLVRKVLEDIARRVDPSAIAAAFHRTLCEIIVRVAEDVGEERVVLTGGCFQNRILTEQAVEMLRAEGFRPYWHQRVPPNDGGIALGQVNAVLRMRSHGGGNSQQTATMPAKYGRRGIA